MKKNNLRVLVVNEFSKLATGFSVMGELLLKEMHRRGYVVAEVAAYINPTHPGIDEVPWKVYPAQPYPGDERGWAQHNRNPTAQFGSDVINDALLDFMPDVVISWRDCWMDTFIQQTPYRKYFKWIYMPTVDGEPQRLDWLYLYKQADYINTYTRWAKNILTKEGIKVYNVATPGPDLKTFSPPLDKRAHKEKMGINPDWFIFGSVMRNQPRKLFPDLLHAFAIYLNNIKDTNPTLAANSYLHLHTSIVDVGWDIAAEIQKYNLSHKVLLTYVDETTGESYLSFYKGPRAWSMIHPDKKCAVTPNTSGQLGREAVANIVKCYDLYIQYSICEGLGIPLLEANACGVPAMGMPYSATAELVDEPGNISLSIAGWRQELPHETSQRRAVGDPYNLAFEMQKFAEQTSEQREAQGKLVRQLVECKYNESVFTNGFISLLEEIDLSGYRSNWKVQPEIITPDHNPPPNFVLNEDFIIWAHNNILGRPFILTKETLDNYAKMLDVGHRRSMENGIPRTSPFTRQDVYQELMALCHRLNDLEILRYHRCNNLALPSRPKFRSV